MIRLAIIGAGGMALYQVRKFADISGCEIVACADHCIEHAESFAERWGISRRYASLADLMDAGGFDALSCVVVDGAHRRICETALGAGISVLCEKPLARNLADARTMAAAALAARVPALVNFSKRNARALTALKAVVESGELGDIERVEASYLQNWVVTKAWGDWATDPRRMWRLAPAESTAGVLGDLGSHLLDALRFVLGSLRASAPGSGIGLREAMDADLVPREAIPRELEISRDETTPYVRFEATLEMGTGQPISFRASWIEPSALDDFRIRVIGSRAEALLDLRATRDFVEVKSPYGTRSVEGSPSPSIYECFIRAVEEGTLVKPDFADGLEVQRLIAELLPSGEGSR
jgi:predicted dehydrogenase